MERENCTLSKQIRTDKRLCTNHSTGEEEEHKAVLTGDGSTVGFEKDGGRRKEPGLKFCYKKKIAKLRKKETKKE